MSAARPTGARRVRFSKLLKGEIKTQACCRYRQLRITQKDLCSSASVLGRTSFEPLLSRWAAVPKLFESECTQSVATVRSVARPLPSLGLLPGKVDSREMNFHFLTAGLFSMAKRVRWKLAIATHSKPYTAGRGFGDR